MSTILKSFQEQHHHKFVQLSNENFTPITHLQRVDSTPSLPNTSPQHRQSTQSMSTSHQPAVTNPEEKSSISPAPLQSNTPEMAISSKTIPLTLIVATTPKLGIGFNGSLPWPSLRAEMAYFARVTKRVVTGESTSTTSSPTPLASTTPAASNTSQTSTTPQPSTASQSQPPRTLNAVIMGRKTYESIPPRFRPLKDRLNIVLTRSTAPEPSPTNPEGPFYLPSLLSVLDFLAEPQRARTTGRVFVIGGAEVYAQAARLDNCCRVLRTRIEREYECDVWFPVDLEGDTRWKRAPHEALQGWVGEGVPEEGRQDGDGEGVGWRYEMWERQEHEHDEGNEKRLV